MVAINRALGFQRWGIDSDYGSVIYADSNEIIMALGNRGFHYAGSFEYDEYGNVRGTLTGYTEYLCGYVVFKAAGVSVDASLAQAIINTGDAAALVFLIRFTAQDVQYDLAGMAASAVSATTAINGRLADAGDVLATGIGSSRPSMAGCFQS